jgi:hypothetical protein
MSAAGSGPAVKRVVVAGKGRLAIDVARWFDRHPSYELAGIAPVAAEPSWAASLTEAFRGSGVPLLGHGQLIAGRCDVLFSCYYDRILPKALLDRVGLALNLHSAPLPAYRGVRPINWALKNGERSHGVTIHGMTEGIDDGPIYGQATFSIWPEVDEVRDVYGRCLHYGWRLFDDTMTRIDSITPLPQDDAAATIYYSSRDADLGDRLGWVRAATGQANEPPENA